MATKAQLRAALGSAWHVNAEAFYDLVASDGSGVAAGAFTNLTASGNVALGDAITDTFGVYGVAPTAQLAHADQAAVTTATITALATTAATQTTPWGFATQAQADAIATAANSLITRIGLVDTLLNRIRADLVTIGFIKGAA